MVMISVVVSYTFIGVGTEERNDELTNSSERGQPFLF